MKNRSLTHRIALLLCTITFLNFPAKSFARDTVERVAYAGDVLQFLLPSSIAGLSLLFADPEGTAQLASSFISTLAVTWALKLTINAKRANGGSYSMPSGHTAAAFAAASFGQKRYGLALGLPYYLAAGFTGWSRVYSDNHFARDVAVGAFLGITIPVLLTERIEHRIRLLPFSGRGGYGLRIERSF